jgi:hypothetical protein
MPSQERAKEMMPIAVRAYQNKREMRNISHSRAARPLPQRACRANP